MGGLLHLFDSETRSMARKIVSHKKQNGFDAPRDSLELPNGSYQTYYDTRESPVEEDWPDYNCYPFEAPMKKLISEEISKNPSTRQSNGPSIVARLMGMDVMMGGSDMKLMEKRNGNARAKLSNNGLICHLSRNSSTSRQTRLEMCYPESNEERPGRPRNREHPQEEELQRFKKDFVAWQTARLKDCSRLAELDNLPPKLPAPRTPKAERERKPFSLQRRDSSATKIVVLKPGPDQRLFGDSWSSSSPCSPDHQRGSIEDFLEEVRDRLKHEMQGKMLRLGGSVAARGSGIETPFSEKPLDPKLAGDQARLVRSESARSHGLVSERLKRALKKKGGEKGGHSRSRSVLDRSVRGGSSPRSLERSLSAPVSGTSFGKLLLEDRHVLTGGHVRRKLEAAQNNGASKTRKLNFKDRVSSLRYSFSLRRRLFGKKIIPSPAMEPTLFSRNSPFNDIAGGPTVVSNFGERHDNFTEVPPSPASVCSSIDHLGSPQLTPDITPCHDYAFREISSNLFELRRQLNQLEGVIASSNPEEEPELFPELKDPAESYVRDLLVTSGLYDGSSSEKFSMKWETLSEPLSASVFREVEDRYKKPSSSSLKREDRKLLHDLLNESLSMILGHPSSSTFRGKELMHCAWEIVGRQFRSSVDERAVDFLDNLVAHDLRSKPWTGSTDEIVAELVREIENLVMGDLVRETLETMRVF